MFRILDNFNIPLGAAEGSGGSDLAGMRSATLWTTAHDMKSKVIYYHTQHNRQVRKIDLGSLDFANINEVLILPLDERKEQAIKDR